MIDLETRRRLYAEEIEAVANLRTPPVIEALGSVARERFLPPGPWTIRSEADLHAPPRHTADADPRHVYHNVAVAIDATRMLFNGAPSVVAGGIDALAPAPGLRALHIGTGLGYYTAVLAHCVGKTGRVLGIEVDSALAAEAAANLSDIPWVEVLTGDASAPFNEAFDVILINAGVTHPLPHWLDALAAGGRMIVPLTATMDPQPIGKGPMLLVTRSTDPDRFAAKPAGFVAIYSAVGIRDQAMNTAIGQALAKMPFAPVKSLRRDPHERTGSCWIHDAGVCISLS
jgi:protein-L-isoaspartate(D-aspartate) O-methyltransferase